MEEQRGKMESQDTSGFTFENPLKEFVFRQETVCLIMKLTRISLHSIWPSPTNPVAIVLFLAFLLLSFQFLPKQMSLLGVEINKTNESINRTEEQEIPLPNLKKFLTNHRN